MNLLVFNLKKGDRGEMMQEINTSTVISMLTGIYQARESIEKQKQSIKKYEKRKEDILGKE